MRRISGWPDNPAFFKIVVSGQIPDLKAGYPAGY
jgi:hypothetical protein